jgi:hypothetical protein
MKRSFNSTLLACVVLASLALTPAVEAARGGGGGGGARAGGGGGGAQAGNRASGGGGANRQVDSSKADARSNNVRSTSANSVNNTNVNRNSTTVNRNTNVNVNVDNNNNCCNGGWDNDYHPVARGVAVGAAVAVTAAVVGSMVQTVPPGCVPVNYGGMVYQQCGAAWYQPQGSQFVVVNPPY